MVHGSMRTVMLPKRSALRPGTASTATFEISGLFCAQHINDGVSLCRPHTQSLQAALMQDSSKAPRAWLRNRRGALPAQKPTEGWRPPPAPTTAGPARPACGWHACSSAAHPPWPAQQAFGGAQCKGPGALVTCLRGHVHRVLNRGSERGRLNHACSTCMQQHTGKETGAYISAIDVEEAANSRCSCCCQLVQLPLLPRLGGLVRNGLCCRLWKALKKVLHSQQQCRNRVCYTLLPARRSAACHSN